MMDRNKNKSVLHSTENLDQVKILQGNKKVYPL